MQREMDSIYNHGVYNLTELPEGRKEIGSMWVFKINMG